MLTCREVSDSPPAYGSCSPYHAPLWLSLTLGNCLRTRILFLSSAPAWLPHDSQGITECLPSGFWSPRARCDGYLLCKLERNSTVNLAGLWGHLQKGLTEQGRYIPSVDSIILWDESLDWEELRGSEWEHPSLFPGCRNDRCLTFRPPWQTACYKPKPAP